MKTVIILGAGLAGTILANRLSKIYKVYLIDIKSKDLSYPDFNKESSNLAAVPTFSYGLGGTSNLWHNGLIDINPDHVDNDEFSKLLKWINKYEDDAFSILTNRTMNLSDLSHLNETIFTNMDRIIYPKTNYTHNLHERITFIGNVSDVDFKVENDKVTQINFLSSEDRIQLSFDYLIISCGGLNSSQYVDLIRNKQRYGGGNFNDHPMGFVGKIRVKKQYKDVFNEIAIQSHEKFEVRRCFVLKDKHNKLKGAIYLRNAATKTHSLKVAKHKSKLGSSAGVLSQFKAALNTLTFHPDIILEIVKHIFGYSPRTRTFSMMFVGEQKHRPSKILSQSNSKAGMKLDWVVTELELDSYNEMISSFLKEYSEYIESFSFEKITKKDLWSAAHYSGSNSVGEVVDNRLAIKGFSNVHVCDGSVISGHSYANTGLVIAKLCCYLTDEVLN
ncbi:hypothetical protein QSC59_002272 [Vibrio alginolyticus]|nr:hypothetical protein [Vibrio alginolyticus]